MPKPQIRGRNIAKKIIRNRFLYPAGLVDKTSLHGRFAYWNYAALCRTSPKEDLGFKLIQETFGACDVVAIGLAQRWEILKAQAHFEDIVHVAMSPYLAWVMCDKRGLWCSTIYVPSGLASEFSFPNGNWILLKILEIADDPWNWIEAAKNSASEWVYVVIDRSMKHRIHDIHAKDVLEKFPEEEWEAKIGLLESQRWIDRQNKLWTAIQNRMIVPMIFLRK